MLFIYVLTVTHQTSNMFQAMNEGEKNIKTAESEDKDLSPGVTTSRHLGLSEPLVYICEAGIIAGLLFLRAVSTIKCSDSKELNKLYTFNEQLNGSL